MTLFIVSFIAGVLTVLAPCVLPLLPVILAGSVSEVANKRRPLIIISSLSLSVFVFTLILKGSTALINVGPSFWSIISAIILTAFGLTLIFPDAWARIVLKIPGHNRPDSWIARGYGGRGDFWTDVLVGAALGPVFTTCSPTFFVILATVLPQSLVMGMIDLAAYITGLALVLLLVAFIGQKIIDKLEWATNPYGWFKRTLGVIFVLLGLLIVTGFDKKTESLILNSGFFDVTNLEQSIHLALEGGQKTPTVQNISQNISATSTNPLNSLLKGRGNFTEIEKPAGFINSDSFRLVDFVHKKVILVDFIDYTCINCQRTFPYLNDWWQKYKDQGLEVVAIHTPEFAFEKDINNVKMGAKQFKLEFPIVLDNDYATWNAYKNQYWPHKYLIDIYGNVVYEHIGEGAYEETEEKIVELLNQKKSVLGEKGEVNMATSLPKKQIMAGSPETYFGALRNERFGNGAPYLVGQADFRIPESLNNNYFYLGGKWNIDREYAENKETSATIAYKFLASKVYLVAENVSGKSLKAKILIDGKPIENSQKGADVDKDGFVKIDQSRLYWLFGADKAESHRIDIIFDGPGGRAYTFTFG